ncbi:hypothetical protein BG000_004933 [Podila horticola]|nr:hypothetical protein BG000_004933 [Podila horticola]
MGGDAFEFDRVLGAIDSQTNLLIAKPEEKSLQKKEPDQWKPATSNAFSVKIPSNDSVDDLKKLIKTEQSPALHVDVVTKGGEISCHIGSCFD